MQICGEKLDQTKRAMFITFTVVFCRHETCRKPPKISTREMGVASCKPSSSSSPISILAILDDNILTVPRKKTNLCVDLGLYKHMQEGELIGIGLKNKMVA